MGHGNLFFRCLSFCFSLLRYFCDKRLQQAVRNVEVVVSSGAEKEIWFVGSVEVGTAGHKKPEPVGKTIYDTFVK